MTPEQMKALADRLDHFALGSGDIGKAADLIRQMAESEPTVGSVVVTTDANQNVVAVTLNDENDQVRRVVWERKVPARDDTALLRQALEALESCGTGAPSDGERQWYDETMVEPAITAIRARLDGARKGEA